MRGFPNASPMPERWGHPDPTMQMQLYWSHGPRAHIKTTPLGVWLGSSLAASNCCWITIRPPKASEGQMFSWQIWGPILITIPWTQKQSQIPRPRGQFFLLKNTGLVPKCHQMSQHESMLESPGWRIKAYNTEGRFRSWVSDLLHQP